MTSKDCISVDGKHFYRINNSMMPSVTSILKLLPEGEGLKIWKSNMKRDGKDADAEMRKSGTVGTIVHYRIAQYFSEHFRTAPEELDLQGATVTEDMYPLIDGGFKNFMDFIKLHKVVPRLVECTTYHLEMSYAGCIDCIGEFGPERIMSIIDWKTSKGIWPNHRAQVVAYRRAINTRAKTLPFGEVRQCVLVGLNALTGLHVEVITPEQEGPHWDLFWTAYDKYQKAEKAEIDWVKREEAP